jgi:hypothetical protein
MQQEWAMTHLLWQRAQRTDRRKVLGDCPRPGSSPAYENSQTHPEDKRVLAAMPATASALAAITKLDPFCVGGSVSRLQRDGRASKVGKVWVTLPRHQS